MTHASGPREATGEREGRSTGIPPVGAVPWGTHFCHFYESREDLLEIVVPYLRAGLGQNEFCLWVTCGPCDPPVGLRELREALPGVDDHLRRGDLEIVSCRDWYLPDGEFRPERVVAGWQGRLERALARGYDGMRVHANEAWLTRTTRAEFARYEQELDERLAEQRMLVLCTYPLAGSTGGEVFDVARTHALALARREGTWEVLEAVEPAAVKAEVQRLNAELETRVEVRTRELEAATAALRESEELYRFLAENSEDMITLYDVAFRRVYVSPSTVRQLGPLPEDPRGRLHPDDRAAFERAARRALEGERTLVTFRYAQPDGSWRWLESSGSLATYKGRPHVLNVTRDVTARRQAEDAHLWFLESLDRVNRAIQRAADIEEMMGSVLDEVVDIFDADLAGFMYPCDAAAPEWTVPVIRLRPGLPIEGPSVGATIPQTADTIAMVGLLRSTPGPVQFGPGPGQRPPLDVDRMLGLQATMSQAIYPKGDQPYLFGIGQVRYPRVWSPEEEQLSKEIGHRLADALTSLIMLRTLTRSEHELRVSEARFRIFVDHATDAFFLHDERGVILDANQQACEMLGYARDELIGMAAEDLDAEAEASRSAALETRLAAGEIVALDTRLRRKDGSVVTVEVRGRPFWERGRRFAVSLVRDTTERKRLEEEVRQAQKMEAIGRLAGGVAHDFNNLLTAILGYAELMLLDLPAGSTATADAEEIKLAAERARGLTRQLLAFSRQQILQPRVVDVARTIGGIERMLRLLLQENVRFEVRTCGGPLPVRVDPIQIEQILMNLVVNARDATEPGGSITVECGFAESPPGGSGPPPGYARIEVSDTGTGIPPEVVPKIFEPFFTTKPAGTGTGLGLSTVHGIVQQSGGHIRVHSEPGVGTRFTVLLPLTSDDPAPPSEAAATAHDVLDGRSVVVVEDDHAVCRLVVATLQRGGMHVLAFPSPDEALAVLGDPGHPVDVVVSDVVLPGMSGPEMVERVRAVRPGLRVVYMSGYAPEEALLAHSIRDANVLEKPFGPEVLLDRIRAALS